MIVSCNTNDLKIIALIIIYNAILSDSANGNASVNTNAYARANVNVNYNDNTTIIT